MTSFSEAIAEEGTNFVVGRSPKGRLPARCPNCRQAWTIEGYQIHGFREATGRWWATCGACDKEVAAAKGH